MIKVKPRTAVPQEMAGALKSVTRARLARMKEEMQGYGHPRYQQMYVQQNGLAIARMQRLLKDPAAMDMEITRLRGLRFIKYWMEPAHRPEDDEGYFAAETEEIVIAHDGDQWNIGPYRVYLPVAAFLKGQVGSFGQAVGFHFIPQFEPMAGQRHMHHVADDNFDAVRKRDPLLMNPSTCWGGFGPVIVGNIKDCDVVETFRTIYTYLGRYNAGSPLWHGLRGMTFRRAL